MSGGKTYEKKGIAILLGVAMAVSVVACGGEEDANSAPETKVEQNVAPAGEEQKIPETDNAEDEASQENGGLFLILQMVTLMYILIHQR